MAQDINPQLDVTLPSRVPSGDAKIVGTITFINAGLKPLWVNGRMLLNSEYAPPVTREVWLEIEGPNSRKVEFRCKVRAGAAKPGDFVLLKSQEKKSIKVNLSDCFDFHEPGTYTIHANYQDGAGAVPESPSGAVSVRQRVRSAAATLEVVPEPAVVR